MYKGIAAIVRFFCVIRQPYRFLVLKDPGMTLRFHRPFLFLCLVALANFCSSLVSAEPAPDWAYPGMGSASLSAGGWNTTEPLRVPGSSEIFTEAQIHSRSQVIDWFPDTHPPVPAFMKKADDPSIWACAKCHMPSGSGRPENAAVAGLPADYIFAQVPALMHGERKYPEAIDRPSTLMNDASRVLTTDQIKAAARYYASLRYRSYIDVIETENVPALEEFGQVWFAIPGPPEPLGARIIEVPEDRDLFERRDPYGRYKAYVPKGSIKRGRALAMKGAGDATKFCATCNGNGLRGGADLPAPPLAGRFPAYLFRQLYGFRTGAHAGSNAELMTAVVKDMTLDQMIDLAAYAASLRP
jgi:cytochrome c553